MALRRIVTGHVEGKSIVVSDGPPSRARDFDAIPGMRVSAVWSTEAGAAVPEAGADPTGEIATFAPPPGATRFLVVQFPPDGVYAEPGFDGAAADAENLQVIPGLADRFEPDAPGMHATDSVDYAIVLSGTPALELDDGAVTPLRAGDIVVQNGTRHAWRNPGPDPATLAFVLIGAPRARPDSPPDR